MSALKTMDAIQWTCGRVVQANPKSPTQRHGAVKSSHQSRLSYLLEPIRILAQVPAGKEQMYELNAFIARILLSSQPVFQSLRMSEAICIPAFDRSCSFE